MSNSIERAGTAPVAAALFCILTGIASVAIDVLLHVPLHLPGHHGLTQMALLVIAACITGRPWAATLSAAAAAGVAAIPALGLDPFAPSMYLVSGLVIDGLCLLAGQSLRERTWFWGILGGMGNAAKAVEIWLMGRHTHGHLHLGNLAFSGVSFSVASHVAFGAIGGWLAAQIWVASRGSKAQRD